MNGDLKLTFTQKVLSDYFREVSEAMAIAAARAKVGVTGEAIKSLSYQSMLLGGGATGNLSFKEYLRFVDMGVGRAHPLGGLTTMKATLQASRKEGFELLKSKVRKPKKVYSKVAYGKLTWLQNNLLYGYTEETIAMLKKEMQQ